MRRFFRWMFGRPQAPRHPVHLGPPPPLPPAPSPPFPGRHISPEMLPSPMSVVRAARQDAPPAPAPPSHPVLSEPDFVPFRFGYPHVEVSTLDGTCLVITPDHPLFEEFRRWGAIWTEPRREDRVLRIHANALGRPPVGGPTRGRVQARPR